MLNTECSKCGCTGLHACIGVRYIETPEDKARNRKQLKEIVANLNRLSENSFLKTRTF
jgi:hypothetical protein